MNPNQYQALAIAQGQQPTKRLDYTNIKMDMLMQEYRASMEWVEQNTRDFPQLDQIVDGVPLNYDSEVPFVGDTTLAGLVRSIPRNSLQQLPVFSVAVNGTENSIPALACTFLLKDKVFNEDTFGKGLLSTLQIGTEQALTHGYAPFFVAAGSMYDDYGTTLRLLHWKDTAPERGITDHNETGFDFIVANLPESRVRKILRAAEKNPNTTWDVEALKKVLESPPKPSTYSYFASDPRKNAAAEASSLTYEFVTREEVGKGGTRITFCPQWSERPLRVIESKSKWGYPKVNYLVIDPAALTPFGVSRVRLASPNQNLMNIYYGNIAAMLILNSKPPVFKRGRFTTPIQLKTGVTWESNDPSAEVKMMNLDNGSLQWFDKFQTQFAGQIQNIMAGQLAAVSAGSKDSFGKTGPGQRRAQAFEDVNTNQITKILENFLRQHALVALDTLLSEQEGEDYIIVDDETKNAMNQIEPGFIGDDNKMLMEWEKFYASIEKWSVKILVSVSKDELDEKKRADLQDMQVTLLQNADGNPEAIDRANQITDQLMKDKAPLIKPLGPTPPPVATPQPAQPGTELTQ